MLNRFKFPLLLVLSMCAVCACRAKADDFATARANHVRRLVGTSDNSTTDATASAQLTAISNVAVFWENSMTAKSGRVSLWTDLPFPTATDSTSKATWSAHMTSSYARLEAMALGYATPNNTSYHNADLLAAIKDGLDWMYNNIYTTSAPVAPNEYGNWWDWEIGSPLQLNDTLTLLYADLGSLVSTYEASVQRYTPKPAYTAANYVWTSHVVALSGVLLNSDSRVKLGLTNLMDPLSDRTSSSTTTDGFYADGSFVQHGDLAYTGGYGISEMLQMSQLISEFAGTSYALSQAIIDRESYLLLNSFKPLIYKGEMHDSVRGRTIARWNNEGHVAGRPVVGVFVQHALVASTAIPSGRSTSDRTELQKAAKYWMLQDSTFATAAGFDSPDTTAKAEALTAAGNTVPNLAEPTGFFSFGTMDRFVHLRPGWGASLALFSSTIKSFEAINSENKHGWHTGDGYLSLYAYDEDQHSGNFWPTVDPYRLEGVTALKNTAISSGVSGETFVGGLKSYGSAYGLAAMSLAPSTPLTGKKAWFFFDNEIVCLGSDITSTGTTNVETTIVNRKLTGSGNNVVTTNAGAASSSSPVAEPAPPHTIQNLQYLHLAMESSSNGIGYFFPTPTTVNVLRETRQHAWTEINGNANTASHTDSYSNNFYTAYIDHGASVSGATYAYAILPQTTASALASYAASPDFKVVENSASAQSVKDTSTGAIGVVFWKGNYTVGSGSGSITSSAPALVHAIYTSSQIQLTATDPTHALTSPFKITLGASATSNDPPPAGVTVNSLSPATITIDPSQLTTDTAYIRFYR